MDRQLDNDIEAKSRDLARKITVAHDLDPEIQEELYGHIEDKLLAYKSGEAPITEDDKGILARYRLGGLDCASRRLTIAQPPALRIGWFRQVLLLAVATTGAIITAQVLLDAYRWCFPWREFENEFLKYQARSGAHLLVYFAVPGLLLLTLLRWSAALRQGARPWFARIPLAYLAATALLLIIAGDAIPKILIPLDGRGLNVEIWWMTRPNAVSTFLARGALCLIWMTWTCSLSRNALRAAITGMAWVLFYHLASIVPGSIAILFENANQRLYAPYWLGEIAWRQLWSHRLPGHAAMYLTIVAVCTVLILLATRDWRGIGRVLRKCRQPQIGKSNVAGMNDSYADGLSLSDDEALVLVREHLGDAEELRAQLQRVHLGVASALPTRRILALAITTLALCGIADIIGSALRLAAVTGVASEVIEESSALQIAVGFFDLPLVCIGLICMLVHWNRAQRGGPAPWFQRWSLRRMAIAATVLLALQLVLPSAVILPNYALGGTALAKNLMELLIVVPALLALWLWWSGAMNDGARRMAIVICSLAPILMVVLLQPVKIFVLMPKVWVVDEAPFWLYLKGTKLGELDVDWYFAPGWDRIFVGVMNFYLLCALATVLLVGVAQLGREASLVRSSFRTPNDAPPTISAK